MLQQSTKKLYTRNLPYGPEANRFEALRDTLLNPVICPMPLVRIPEPFDHLEWLFEPKIDGFRCLAIVEGHRCQLVSRRGHVFREWDVLSVTRHYRKAFV